MIGADAIDDDLSLLRQLIELCRVELNHQDIYSELVRAKAIKIHNGASPYLAGHDPGSIPSAP